MLYINYEIRDESSYNYSVICEYFVSSIYSHVRLRSHRGRSKSTFEMVEDYHDYDNTATVARNSNVTVTQVSIN